VARLKPLDFIRLVRLPNLLISALALSAMRWGMMAPLGVDLVLSDLLFALLIASVMLIQAAGYVINDVFDLKTDLHNRPERMVIGKALNEEAGWRLFFGLFLAGSLLGWWVGRATLLPWPGLIPAFSGFLLFIYASELKGRPLIGNAAVALLSALVLLLPMCFDILPDLSGERDTGIDPLRRAMVQASLAYALAAFLGSLWREMVKDLEDLPGDRHAQIQTAPLVWGETAMRRVSAIFGLLIGLGTLALGVLMAQSSAPSGAYVLLFCALPLFWALAELWRSRYKKAQNRIKISMGFIALSPAVFTAILLYF